MDQKHPTGPQCNCDNVAAIAFAYPSPEMFEEAERGDIVLGGCRIEQDDPEWHCKDCGREW